MRLEQWLQKRCGKQKSREPKKCNFCDRKKKISVYHRKKPMCVDCIKIYFQEV